MEDAELSDVTSAYEWADFHGLGAARLAEAAAKACGGSFAIMNFTAQSGATVVFEREGLLELQGFIARTPALRLGSEADWEAFRIAEAFGRFGVDFGETDNPHEAGLDRRAVSWSKGCYLGQEVVCMQDMRGKLKRRLVALAFDTADLPQAGSPVTVNDGAEAVGELTSVARSPVTGKAVALARLKSPYFEGKVALGVAGMKAAFVAQSAPEIG
jgi:hypothetical protein